MRTAIVEAVVSLCGLAVVLAGCATPTVPMQQNVAATLKGKTVARTTYAAKPDFTAMTPANGAFGLVGALAAISAGNSLVNDNGLTVPSDTIGQVLVSQLRDERGMRMAVEPVATSSDDIGRIVAAAKGKADYVLDVQTTGWGITYYPTHWGSYRVNHSAHARLIDVADNRVVAQGRCLTGPDYTDQAPSYNELLDNRAAGLKSRLSLAGDECVAILKRTLAL